ncbi:hypothetical protein BU26DRAFT_570989 [Trematosphaeria pertusa]|uniref:Uncharacterized protein n=1 Tax=Trematosphaeria pertusa TaxID=390896 RepID=A0A6A6HW98_9PLEO|nr:uncharacterized protein BU26DRAFT_570989 [Trematosphaeria pertusa]KAF2242307.1 hypothetical protein BU26DRAFT_570989 [Trematosphaeria pertusa]
MGVSRIEHRGKHAARPQSARECRAYREASIARPLTRTHSLSSRAAWKDGFEGDRYVPVGSSFWQRFKSGASGSSMLTSLNREMDDGLFYEDGASSPDSTGCSSVGSKVSLPTAHSRCSVDDIDDYLELLYGHSRLQDKLSSVLQEQEVIADYHRRQYHWGEECARQFDMTQPYVLDMLRYMYERFNAVSFYSIGMIEPGMIVYYLEPYTLGLDQNNQGCGTATVGGTRFEARVHLKGRFAIVVEKYAQHLKVAEILTFGHKGLQSKPPKVWPEYVGLRAVEHKNWSNPSPNKALEVGYSCCEILPQSSAHLVTDKVALSNQILCAGYVTHDSLHRLRALIRKTEGRMYQ